MAELVAIVPSRGRPGTVRPLVEAFDETCTADTILVFTVDASDPDGGRYARELGDDPIDAGGTGGTGGEPWVHFADRRRRVLRTPSGSMVEALNLAAAGIAEHVRPFAVAFLGDDHRPRTRGWDASYLDALRDLGTGLVFGDDLLQREHLPTQVAMTADVVRELGFMAPPELTHLFVDNFWRDLGTRAECLRYLPDVVVEHLHPVAGKAHVDEGYRRVNAAGMYSSDQSAYARYLAEGLDADVARIRMLRAGVRA